MDIKYKGQIYLVFIFIYSLLYYAWLALFQSHDYIQSIGGNVFSIIGPSIATLWLAGAYKRSDTENKPFWLLMTLGLFSILLAELSSFTYESYFVTSALSLSP